VRLRKFEEETGTALSPAELIELGSVRQKGGKVVTAGPPKAASTPTPSATPSRWSGLLARDPSPSSPRSIGPPGSTQTPHAASWVAAPAAFVDGLAERLR
jgi:hypothetical protein